MKIVLFAVSMCLLLIPGMVQAGQPETEVECVEGTPPEPIEVEFGEHTSGCQVDNGTDLDQFQTPIGTEDFGKLLRLNVTRTGGSYFTPRVEVWDPSGGNLDNSVSPNYSNDFGLIETGEYLVAISDDDRYHPGSYEAEVNCLPPGGCPPTPTEGPPGDPSCSDGIDNDKDGFIDVEDPDCGCTEPADCDDSDACTDDDCIDNQCQYSPVNCDDTNACTEDTCDTVSGCVNTCNVGQSCPLPGSCAPAQGQCAIDGLECVCQAQ